LKRNGIGMIDPAFGRKDNGIALPAWREINCVLGRDINSPLKGCGRNLAERRLGGQII
jgi:hypothetical protein